MTGPTPRDEPPRRPIDRTYSRDAEGNRPTPADLHESALGGADAVPDTPGVAAHGAHVGEERRRTPRANPGTLAQVSAGKGTSMWLSIAGIAIVLILLAVMFF
ncbi:MAG: hypothetical protein ACT4PJ_01375 [Gemmatimonadaceae bacterium]